MRALVHAGLEHASLTPSGWQEVDNEPANHVNIDLVNQTFSNLAVPLTTSLYSLFSPLHLQSKTDVSRRADWQSKIRQHEPGPTTCSYPRRMHHAVGVVVANTITPTLSILRQRFSHIIDLHCPHGCDSMCLLLPKTKPND